MTNAAGEPAGLTTPGPGWAMRAALAAQVAVILPVFLIGSLGPLIMVDLAITPFVLGLLVATFYGAAACAALVLAPRADRVGVWRLVCIALAGAAAVALGIGVVGRDTETLFVLILASGLTAGTVQPSTNVVVARYVPDRRQGFAFGLKQSAIPVATLIGGALLPTVGGVLGWQWCFVLAAALPALVAATAPSDGPQRACLVAEPNGRLPRGLLLSLASAMALGAACANAMAAFIAASIVAAGHAPALAGIAIVVGSIACIVARIGFGLAADKWRLPLVRIAAALLLAGALAHIALAFAGSARIVVAATVAAFALGWGWSGILLLAITRAANGTVGRATGITHSGVYLGAVLGPVTFGAIANGLGYLAAWLALATTGFLATGLSWHVAARLDDHMADYRA